tara:strand:- start:4899 stop:5741 length:843 start_codon:yes stop_codon:yes gene_type:complete
MRNNQRRLSGPGQNATPTPKAPVSSASLSYQVPTEFVDLPSRGAFYPEGHPLHGQSSVEIRYMTAKEEDILASTALIKNKLVLDRLFESLLVTEVDPSTLFIGDRSAIMLAARISGYGNIYETKITCPNCGTKNDLLFDLEKATINQNCFDETFMEENSVNIDYSTNLLVVRPPVTNLKIGLRLLDSHAEREFSKLSSENDERRITTALSAFIESVDGSYDRKEVEQFIDNMPAKDSRYLRNIYAKLVPSVELKEDFTCKRCFHQKEMEVPLSAEFFWPR